MLEPKPATCSVKQILAGTLPVGSAVRVRGWVRTRRDSKAGLSFVNLYDGSCFDPIQVVAADTLEHGPLPKPTLALLVSGGHSQLLRIDDLANGITEIGTTVDDAAGEAYDKVARLLDLGYPGGPVIDRLAADGDPRAIAFPRGLAGPRDAERARYDFSFSGLKTAVARYVETERRAGQTVNVADVCASFQEAVADVLTAKTVRAAGDLRIGTVVIAGGVAANGRLRALAAERCAAAGLELRVPRPGLCTDNGAMIAAVGAHVVAAGAAPSGPRLTADPGLSVSTVLAP